MVQLQVLNKILEDKDVSIITSNNLSVDYFSDYKNEFNYILNHINTYGNIPDKTTFLNIFPDFEIIQVDESLNFLLEELYKDRNTRYLATSFNKVRDQLMNNDLDAAMQTYKSIYDGLSQSTNIQCVDITKDISRYDAYEDRLHNFDKYYISTGFPQLDNIVGGWDKEEELALIMARTNVGKSQMLVKCAAAALEQGLTVGMYSGEMSERKVGYRFDTMISNISNGSLIHGNEGIKNQYKHYIEGLPNRFKGAFKVLTPRMINGPAGVGALRAFIEREKLDILFVDQHSLLEDDRKARNPVEKAANISRDLKNLQVMTHVPIISAVQQNRSDTENGITAANVAQSDRIAQDATMILALEKKDDILTMYLIKSRDSENGKKFKYEVDFNHGTFKYLPEEGEEDQTDTGPNYSYSPSISSNSGQEIF